MHARLVVREHDESVPCVGAGGLIERLTCIFQTQATTCAWVELESPELAASPLGNDLSACQALTSFGPRVIVPGQGVTYGLEVDPAGNARDGHRLAYTRDGVQATVAYVIDGHSVGITNAAWPPVWKAIPPLDDRLATLFAGTTDALAQRRLREYTLANGGERRLVTLLTGVGVDRWRDLYDHLEDPEARRDALKLLHARLGDPDEDQVQLLADLTEHPELQPADFTALLANAAERSVRESDDWYAVAPLLEELHRRKHPAAADLACRVFGMQTLSSMPSGDHAYDEMGDPDAVAGALVIIGQQKVPCPWVAIALERDPCSETYRCEPDGGLVEPDGDEAEYDEETGEPILRARPLCGRAAALSALRRGVAAEGDEEYEDIPAADGPVLLGVGYLHGQVPKELVAKNARRMYRFEYPPVPTEQEVEDGAAYDEPCRRPRDLPGAVCHLPLSVTDVTFNGCRLHIDDKAHVVRVEELKPK
ncbi:MAG: hypothetical protein JNK82_40635 [Myxococcaceae bacterium]|nr:hypothetical protein [Myxococcaceae bacterium]